MRHLEGLNDAQRRAVEHTKGPLLVLAGAGAGKTRVITTRVLHIIKEGGVAPERILAITFTNKAAKEMRGRVLTMMENDPTLASDLNYSQPFISTFHTLGASILRDHASRLGFTRHFSIFDRDDSKRTIKQALEHIGEDPKRHEPGKILSKISRKKGDGMSVGVFEEMKQAGLYDKLILQVWHVYESILKAEKALDFDDLILKTVLLLKSEPAILGYYQSRWSHIHIDEFQDTNATQYEFSRLLANKHANICVVGDMDQNIYSWRGANMRHVLDFEKDFPGTEIVVLEENYRSTKKILSAANVVITKNTLRKEKNLFTNGPEGEDITMYEALNEMDEADFVAQKSREYIQSGTPASDIAVLYRANFQSRALEQMFLDYKIPHQVLGTRFFDRKEVKDVLAFLRLSLNPESATDLSRVINAPPRGIGKTTLLKILSKRGGELAPAMKKRVDDFWVLIGSISSKALSVPPSETVAHIIKATGLESVFTAGGEEGLEDLSNVQELVTFAQRYDKHKPEEGVLKLLEDAFLATEQDSIDEKKDGVKLLTIHASKGLEFDVVFITGLEDGLFPHARLDEESLSKESQEEERRLFYVALTRAKKKIFLTHAMTRTIFGSRSNTVPSEFLFDLEDAVVDAESEGGERPKTVYLDM
jgi:DNA helicase-2/ATP-dependent DNA helicase PcrA